MTPLGFLWNSEMNGGENVRKELQLVAIPLFFALVLVSPISAASQGKALGQTFPPPFLKGNWIGLYVSGEVAVPVDQPCFVIHGFGNPNWPHDYSAQEKNSALKDYSFALEIDGESVSLRKWIHFDATTPNYVDLMSIYFYVQFESNQFAVGTYTFHAVWYGPNTAVIWQSLVTVEFY
jgi:hypothetical protein